MRIGPGCLHSRPEALVLNGNIPTVRTPFLAAQFKYLLQTLPHRKQAWLKAWLLLDLFDLVAGYARMQIALRRGAPKLAPPTRVVWWCS